MALSGAISGLVGRTASGNSMILDKVSEGINGLAKAAGTAMGSISKFTTSLTDFLLAPLSNIRGLAAAIAPLVQLFNPGIVNQFHIALNDTLAVMGSMLVPVMQGMTIYVRQFGDALAGLKPVLQPLFNGIGQFIASFSGNFASILQSAAPFIQILGDALAWLLDKISVGVAFFTGVVTELLTVLSSMFGISSRFKSADSSGFAARQTKVSTVGQFADDVFASNAKNVYNRDSGGKKPEEQMLQAIIDGKNLVNEIKEKVTKVVEWLDKHTSLSGITGGASDVVSDKVGNAIGDAFRALGIKKPW